MKDFNYYRSLPESMPIEHVRMEFVELLEVVGRGPLSREEMICSVSELSDRQWNTYSVLDESVKSKIEDVLILYWDGRDLSLTETVLSIVVRLGLGRVLDFLSRATIEEASPEVIKEIKEAVEELRDNILDPYSGL